MVVMLVLLGCSGTSGGGEQGEIFIRFDSDAIAERAMPVLKERMKRAGVRDAKLKAEGGGRVRVAMHPGDLAMSVPLVTRVYGLEICDVVVDLPLEPWAAQTDKEVEEELRAKGTLGPGQRYVAEATDGTRHTALIINSTAVIRSEHVEKAKVDTGQLGEPFVWVELDKEGAAAFESLTRRSVGKKVAILVDGDLKSAPLVAEAIPGGRVAISFAQDDLVGAKRLAAALSTPRLPYKPVFESSGLAGPPSD